MLLVLYVGVTWFNLRRHRVVARASPTDDEFEGWSLARALLVLGAATVVTALIAEILVGSIDTFAESAGLSDFFVAAVIVAIVGNAAEHGGAVVVAHRGNIKLAAEIALASAAQVAVFLIPLVALLSWPIDPLSLSFRPVELGAIAGAVILTAALLAKGESTPLARRGADRRLRRRGDGVLHRRRPLELRSSAATCASSGTSPRELRPAGPLRRARSRAARRARGRRRPT